MKLYICEKPSQAKDLAPFVGATRRGEGGWSGDGVIVANCIGHLLEQAPPQQYVPALERWNLDLLPVAPTQWAMVVKSNTAAQFKVVTKLIKSADEVVIATDADREGEVIAREMLDAAGYRGPVSRLWLSAADSASVKKALANLRTGASTLSMYYAGLGRSRADWSLGMNMTMALTTAFGTGGKDGTLHCGRVQTVVLALIVRRERVIRNFVPKQHYVLQAAFDLGGTQVPMGWLVPDAMLNADRQVTNRAAIDAVASKVRGQTGRIERVETSPGREAPPLLYSLGSLQQEASAKYGMKAQAVLDACQALYETHKATTYPRTDCEHLPVSMFDEARGVFAALPSGDLMRPLIERAQLDKPSRAFNDKKVTAHHAIIPTANASVDVGAMSKDERAVYGLILLRYLAQFLGHFEFLETVIEVGCAGERFRVTGKTPRAMGWKLAYRTDAQVQPDPGADNAGTAVEVSTLPQVTEGAAARNLACKADARMTKPPKRYTEGTLLAAMESIDKEIDDPRLKKVMKDKEKAGIGTDATRSKTIENLFDRSYIANDKKQIVPTEKGAALIKLIERVAPELADPVLTAEWEDRLMQIEAGTYELKQFEAELRIWVAGLIGKIRSHADTGIARIGAAPYDGPPVKCPACGESMFRRKGDKGFFWSCEGYQDGCKQTLPDENGRAGKPRVQAAVSTQYKCTKCGAGLINRKGIAKKSSKPYSFWACSGYPKCKESYEDAGGKPVL